MLCCPASECNTSTPSMVVIVSVLSSLLYTPSCKGCTTQFLHFMYMDILKLVLDCIYSKNYDPSIIMRVTWLLVVLIKTYFATRV